MSTEILKNHGFKPEGVGRLAEQLCEVLLEEKLDNIHGNITSQPTNPNETPKTIFGIFLVTDSDLWDKLENVVREYKNEGASKNQNSDSA